jgi:hypothetical protein
MIRRKSIKREPFGRLISTEEEEEEGAFDSKGILKDGRSVTARMTMRDSADAWRSEMHASMTDAELAQHKPGFHRITDSAALDRVAQAYHDYDATDAQAYRHLTGWGGSDATGEFRGQREGDQCTINGAPGHLRKTGKNKFECVPDSEDAMPVDDDREAAYAEYDRQMANAWRGEA